MLAGGAKVTRDVPPWAMAHGDRARLVGLNLERMRRAVVYRNANAPTVRIEASGGLTIDVARAVGETGVDWIAVGELTHSAPILDIGLDLQDVL